MTTSPIAPRLIKGALIGIDIFNPLASVIVFQYNPDTMTRRLDARSTGSTDGGDRSEAFRLSGPPRETITMNVEFDAADQVDQTGAQTTFGVYPSLSALEMLLYPKSSVVIANAAAAQGGILEIVPVEAPPTFLIWGPQRVLPVRLTGFSITEEAYDGLLNPIRAKVDLSLLVLSYHDLKISSPSYFIFLAHQIAKEVLATSNVVNSAVNFGVSLKLF